MFLADRGTKALSQTDNSVFGNCKYFSIVILRDGAGEKCRTRVPQEAV